MFDYSPTGTVLLNTKNKKNYIIIETDYNGDDDYYSTIVVIELDLYNRLGAEFKKSEIEDSIQKVESACRDNNDYIIIGKHCGIEKEILYRKRVN